MVLPAASCADDIPGDTSCSTLSDIGDRIRTVAWEGLVACQDPSCADREYRTFLDQGPLIQDPLGDSLIVCMTSVQVISGSTTSQGSLLPVGVYRAEFLVQVRDNGWPMIEADDFGEIIEVPDWRMVNVLTKHALGHGEKMWRTLVNSVQKNQMFTLPANPHIGKVAVSQLRPLAPSSFIVGYECAVSVETTLP